MGWFNHQPVSIGVHMVLEPFPSIPFPSQKSTTSSIPGKETMADPTKPTSTTRGMLPGIPIQWWISPSETRTLFSEYWQRNLGIKKSSILWIQVLGPHGSYMGCKPWFVEEMFWLFDWLSWKTLIVEFFFAVWNLKQPLKILDVWGKNHFPCKDSISHLIETSIFRCFCFISFHSCLSTFKFLDMGGIPHYIDRVSAECIWKETLDKETRLYQEALRDTDWSTGDT